MIPKIFLFLVTIGSLAFAEIEYQRCEVWASQNPVIQTVLPYADEGSVYPLRQNGQCLLVAGLQINADAQRVRKWLERDFKINKIALQYIPSKQRVRGQTQWLISHQKQISMITLASSGDAESQIQIYCVMSDPAFAADFPSITDSCPSLNNISAQTLLHLERFDNRHSNLTQLMELPEPIEQAIPRINAHFCGTGWTPVATPVKGENGSVLMLFIEAHHSILITLLERNGKTMMLSNAHPRQLIPRFKLIP